MKTIRERILNVRISSFATTTYRVPQGYSVKDVSVSSDSAGDTITIKKDSVPLGTFICTAINTRYSFQYDFGLLEAGSWVMTIEHRTGTGTAYIELSTERPPVVTSGAEVDYVFTSDEIAAIRGSSDPTGANPVATIADIHRIVRGNYYYHAQSLTADTAGDWRTYSDANGFYTDYCTVGNAAKGGGTWVNKFKVEI